MTQNDSNWEEIVKSSEELCEEVFNTASQTLKTINILGFAELLNGPKPNAEDNLARIRIYESVFSALISFLERKEDFIMVNKIMTARQRIILLEQLICAIKICDYPEAQSIVDRLRAKTR